MADAVLPGRALADLCCDHAWLAVALVREGRVPRAIAIDIHEPPLVAAARALAEVEVEVGGRVELRRGDGFAALEPGEVASVVIAGVGSPLIARILAAARDEGRLVGVERLILHADDGFPRLGELRARLVELGFGLVAETLALERGRFHLVLVAEPGAGVGLRDAVDRELGPLLRRGDDPLFAAWRAREQARVRKAIAGMRAARDASAAIERFEAWLAMLG